jgi:hypothetical protein
MIIPIDDDNYPFRITYNNMYKTTKGYLPYDFLHRMGGKISNKTWQPV